MPSDATAVGAEKCFGNGQAHPGAMQEALPAAPVELVEDVSLLGVVDSLPLVGDAYQQAFCFKRSADAQPEPFEDGADQENEPQPQ